MKRILIIGTGGTIASSPTDEGLTPSLTTEEMLKTVPNLRGACIIESLQAFSLDSTNITPSHWLILARIIRENYRKYDGFVITHGTDTLAYTAAGLSYLIQNSPKPIVLTGAQRPIGEEGTDAKRNIQDAVVCALDSGSHGVCVVFSGAVICGTRARKNYSKSFMAFGSINYPELARVQDAHLIRFVPEPGDTEPVFYDTLNPNVGILNLTPGIDNEVMRFAINKYDGIVVESFGVGGLPEYSDYYVQISDAVRRGKLIVMTTQVPNEGSDLSVYRVGKVLKNSLQVLEAHDMTSEAVFAKLMWILGITREFEKAQELFYRPVSHDILYI